MNDFIIRYHKLVSFLFLIIFLFFDYSVISIGNVGVDAGYFLSICRDWVQLGRIPCIDTFSVYTPMGYVFYSIPFLLFKSPDISKFLLLNLVFFSISAVFLLRILNNLLSNKWLVLFFFISFLYNFHSIVLDIKLENFVLLFTSITSFLLIQLKSETHRRNLIISLIIGLMCALSFLTKQYAALSLAFVCIYILILNIEKRYLLCFSIILSFCLITGSYILFQIWNGLDISTVVKQLTGKTIIDCNGSVYGERKLTNLIVSIKYYKFEFTLLLCFVLLIYYKFVKYSILNKVKTAVQFLLILILTQLPFYFQVFPHYKIFGLPFLYLFAIRSISSIESSYSFKGMPILMFLFLTLYTFYMSVGKFQEDKKAVEIEHQNTRMLNSNIPRNTKVFFLNNRKYWFLGGYTSPFPKTVSYGFVGTDCINEALKFERPKDFWIVNESDGLNESFDKYKCTNSIQLNLENKKLQCSQFQLMN